MNLKNENHFYLNIKLGDIIHFLKKYFKRKIFN
jgi:hypothetical protein